MNFVYNKNIINLILYKKMTILEFFGPPCSGKSLNANFLIKKNKNFVSSNELIFNYSYKFIKLNTLEIASLKYVQIIKFLKKIRK